MKMTVFDVQMRIFVLFFLSLVCFFGCARMDYVKVPTPTQYSEWTDKDQKKADKMKGVRYYLPRPFLHLKQSVPVAQRVAFVSFRFDKSRSAYVLEPPVNPPTWLSRVAPKKISISQALAAVIATPKDDKQIAAEQQSAEIEADKKESDAEKTTGEKPPSTLKSTTGFINQTDPVTKLSDKMDVVYLPDFEEQYVIKPRIGLGTANIETKLRNGWAAETFSMEVDNSEVIPYVIRQVENASEAAAGIATTWLPVAAGLPPGTSPATLLELAGISPGTAAEIQSGVVGGKNDESLAENFLGQVLLFKIAEVRMAQPGIYPILKPREIRQWLKYGNVVVGDDPQASFELFLAHSRVPWIRPDMAFIPCPPFTMVGFNTTTDVFFASATDRTVMSVDNKVVLHADLNKEKGIINEALVNKKNDLTGDADLIIDQALEIKKSQSGNGTDITITAPPGKAFSSDQDTIKKWVMSVFGSISTREGSDVSVKKSEDGQTIEISISVSIFDLANNVNEG